MIKKLVRHGNSRALIIDKPILELIGAEEDGEFTITTRDGRSLTITPVRSAEEERRLAFELAAEDALVRYGETFSKLSSDERAEVLDAAAVEVNRTWGGALKRLAE